MADLSVSLCGHALRNPLVLASGPLSWNAESIRAAYKAGAAAVVTKTIRISPARNPVPHIAAMGRSLLNVEAWSDLPAQQWIEQELPALKERDDVLIVSTGHTPEEVKELALPLAHAGADILELVSYRAVDAAPMVAEAKRAVSIPVLIKVSANWPDLKQTVQACLQAGADGITAIDSIGPALRIDTRTRAPVLHSYGWLSGEAILPLSLCTVATLSTDLSLPGGIVGTGGVTTAQHVLEMVMAGASAVGVHTAPLLQGLGWFGKTLSQLNDWLDENNLPSLTTLRGSALSSIRQMPGMAPLQFRFDAEACTKCGRCETVCAYGARHITPERVVSLDPSRCRFCGLCISVCASGALRA